MKSKKFIEDMFGMADIQIGGSRAGDITVTNDAFYDRVISQGSVGLGEAYMDGLFECNALDVFFDKLLRAEVDKKVKINASLILLAAKSLIRNQQSKAKAFEVGEKHYDAGNDLYEKMLDKRLVYTCAYWKNAQTLDEAQEAKLDLVCRKVGLKPGMKVLDIGCGWASFAKFAAEKYGVSVVGVTVSREQVKLGMELCKGLPVEIRLQDYRDLNEKFDRIISLGMFEHVGYKNYRTYMEVAARCLVDNGIFLLHTIGGNKSVKLIDPWIEKYIFTNAMLPSIAQIAQSIEGVFVMEDWHNFGPDYDTTLMAWYENFEKAWPGLESKYDNRFYRMWKYYLLACAGSFRCRKNQLWQIVFTKRGLRGGYQSIR